MKRYTLSLYPECASDVKISFVRISGLLTYLVVFNLDKAVLIDSTKTLLLLLAEVRNSDRASLKVSTTKNGI